MTTLRFDIELRRITVLPRVLMLASRLGAVVRAVHADGQRVDLTVEAPDEIAHRLGPQLGRIIEVVEITEVDLGAPPFAGS